MSVSAKEAFEAFDALTRAARSLSTFARLHRTAHHIVEMQIEVARSQAARALFDRHYLPAVDQRARQMAATTRFQLPACYRMVALQLTAGAWRPPLDLAHERARLDRMGKNHAALRAEFAPRYGIPTVAA